MGMNNEYSSAELTWRGGRVEEHEVADMKENCEYYKQCVFGRLNLRVNDSVFISNTDANDPDSIDEANIGKICCMYENTNNINDFSKRFRFVVQWYVRPKQIQKEYIKKNEFQIDFDKEIIIDTRKRTNDIAISSILNKFYVLFCNENQNASKELMAIKSSYQMYVCRYMLIKEGGRYNLVPQKYSSIDGPIKTQTTKAAAYLAENKENTPSRDSSSSSTRCKLRLRSNSQCTTPQLLGSTVTTAERKTPSRNKLVTPIKIVNNSVHKIKKRKASKGNDDDDNEDNELIADYNSDESVSKKSKKDQYKTPQKSARRNLSLTLNNECNQATTNYAIVEPNDDISNGMKLKLVISEGRRRSSATQRTPSVKDTAKSNNNSVSSQSENRLKPIFTKCSVRLVNLGLSPIAAAAAAAGAVYTPTKSILKSAISRNNADTPKRSVIVSNIVEEQEINGHRRSIVRHSNRTPRKTHRRDENYADDKNYAPTTPKSSTRRRSSVCPSTPLSSSQMTPSAKMRMFRAGTLTPTIHNRDVPVSNNRSSIQLAKESLHVSAVPKSLPCRENEFNNILSFIECKIVDECGGCMYVSGVPGTGKTATVTEVIRNLKRKADEDEIPEFDFVEINGMRMTEPRQAYVHIYRQLSGKTIPWEQAHSLLEKRFSTPSPHRKTTVLLVDELDILCNRRQDVVYNLLDWPTKLAARLVVVTIANTMDLPERLLMGKVTSRLGLTRLTFQPYSHKQLQEVVMARLAGTSFFKSDAVQLVARKVASVSGDCRRALDICRRSTEIAEAAANANGDADVLVSWEHVQQAIGEMIASSKVRAIKSCAKMEQLFLQAVAAEVARTGVDETTFLGVYRQYESIAALMGSVTPNPGRAMLLCNRLGAMKLLICEHSRTDVYQKILLNVSSDDIHFALNAKV